VNQAKFTSPSSINVASCARLERPGGATSTAAPVNKGFHISMIDASNEHGAKWRKTAGSLPVRHGKASTK
jgi:hypothetical protein